MVLNKRKQQERAIIMKKCTGRQLKVTVLRYYRQDYRKFDITMTAVTAAIRD